jgi:hypothetical protein
MKRLRRLFRPIDPRQAAIPALLLTALLCSFPRQAAAILGIGDIVFDPTSYAELVEQLTQAVKEYNQAVTTYNLLKDELRIISDRNSWVAVATSLPNTAIQDIAGESAMTMSTVNGVPANAPAAWKKATAQLNDTAYLSGEAAGKSPHLSNAASIEIVDGFGADSLNNLGQFRAIQPKLNSAIASLEQRQRSLADADNSPVAQQNITNAALLQLIRMHQSAATLHAATLEQLTVANTWQRNAAAETSNIYGAAITSRKTKLADIAGVADTLKTYGIQ